MVKLENAAKSRRSPLVIIFGSFDLFVEIAIVPGIESGLLDRVDMVDVVAALRAWEQDGTWEQAAAN